MMKYNAEIILVCCNCKKEKLLWEPVLDYFEHEPKRCKCGGIFLPAAKRKDV